MCNHGRIYAGTQSTGIDDQHKSKNEEYINETATPQV